MRFNPPPNWPAPPPGWTPPPGWEPDAAWGPPPHGWSLWVPELPVVQQPYPMQQQQQPQVRPASITYMPVQTNHTFHLLMTIFTFGFWSVLVWLPITMVNLLRKHKVVTRPY